MAGGNCEGWRTHGGSGPRIHRGPEQSRKTARVSSTGADTRKGGIRKAGWDDRVRDSRLFMTVSEKAQGMAKSGLMGGGVLERGKHRKNK